MKKKITLLLSAIGGLAFSQVTSQAFTVSGNFVVPQGVTSVTVNVIGAGGNGAANGGGGGGGGGAATGVYAVTPGAAIPVIIGSAGGGSVTGVTSFSAVLFATPGANGVTVANPNIGGGGNGGGGFGGVTNFSGGDGGGGYWTYFGGGGGGAAGFAANGSAGGNTIAWTGICLTPGGAAGVSGGGQGGAGGKGAGFTDASCNVTDAAGNGLSYGGGGGGGNGNGGQPGIGSDGYCEVFFVGCPVPAAPVNTTPLADLVICESFSTTLTATSSGTINWFNSNVATTPIGTGNSFTVAPTQNTTYYAETSTCNTSTRTAVTVTVNPNPTVSVTSDKASICVSETAVFTATGATTYAWNTAATTNTLSVSPATTTNYTVTGTSNNCSGTATISLVVNPNPTLTLGSSPSTLCAGQSASLTVSGAATYSWNTTATTSMIVVSPTITTQYTVTGTTANNCKSTVVLSQNVATCVATAMSALENEKTDFTVFPNPSNGQFTIRASKKLNLVIINQLGQKVDAVELNDNNSHQALVRNLSPGIYFITERGQNSSVYQKIIISD